MSDTAKKENVVTKKQQPGASITKGAPATKSTDKKVVDTESYPVKEIKELQALPHHGGLYIHTSYFQVEENGEKRATFRGTPVRQSAFVEVIWDPFQKILIVIKTDKKEVFKTFPKLSAAGVYLTNKEKGKVTGYQQERLMVSEFIEAYITDVSEVNQFLNAFADNLSFDWKQYIEL